MSDRLDGTLDPDTVRRVLARAQEIEASAPTTADGISPAVLVEAAAEVGIAPDAVRDALALERLTPAPPVRSLDRFAGPAVIVVERHFDATVADTVDGLDAWLTQRHRLRNIRTSGSTIVYRRRTDTAASVGRLASGARGEGRLGSVDELRVDVAPLIVGSTPARPRVVVRIGADRSTSRRRRLGGGAAVGSVGVGAGVIAIISSPLALIGLPLVAGGYLLARSGRSRADRIELEIERVLSAVERDDPRPGGIGAVVRRARRYGRRA